MVTLALAGPAGEEAFFGSIEDGSDEGDYAMAREYLSHAIADPLRAAAELARCRAAAERLVRSQFGATRIRLFADALLRHGSLSAQEIYEVAAAPASARSLVA